MYAYSSYCWAGALLSIIELGLSYSPKFGPLTFFCAPVFNILAFSFRYSDPALNQSGWTGRKAISNASYDFETRSTTFLDTIITIKNGIIITDHYRKPTDKVQYLLPTSCHPKHIFSNIPFSLALRLVRICSTKELLTQRLNELAEMFLSRNYNKNIVKAAILKASKLDRSEAIKKVIKEQTDRVILAVRYHPC